MPRSRRSELSSTAKPPATTSTSTRYSPADASPARQLVELTSRADPNITNDILAVALERSTLPEAEDHQAYGLTALLGAAGKRNGDSPSDIDCYEMIIRRAGDDTNW